MYYLKSNLDFFASDEVEKQLKLQVNTQFSEDDLFQCEDKYNADYTCNYKVVNGEVVRKTEADFYPEKLQKAKQKKLAELDIFLDKIVIKINGIPVWFNDELVGSLKKTADNLSTIGHTTFPLILKEEMLFLPEGEQRTHILNTVFRIDLNAFKTCLLQMDIYAQMVLLREVTHKNKIKSCATIEAVEAHDFTTGYPEALSLNVEFI